MSAEYVRNVIDAHGLKLHKLSYETRTPYQTLSNWLNNRGELSINQIHRISQYIDYLENLEPFRR